MSKVEICEHRLCTGCAACMNACPKDAIIMSEDSLGYMHPVINAEKCIDCGMCERVCPVLLPLKLNKPKLTYAAISNNVYERQTSSSGGAASVIGRWLIQQGGVVYGCSQENYQLIRHIRVDNEDNIALLKGSKYVQSDINLIYRSVKKDLCNDRKVLFVGTPCQVAGLKRFLRKDYEGLLTADLICHGVPTQRMLREDVESNINFQPELAKNVFVNFRWKAKHGIQYGLQCFINNNSDQTRKLFSTKALPYDPYILAFLTGVSFRENCHTCPYSTSSRVGDITIGDFWKLGSFAPTKFKIKDGVSLLLINTDKGISAMKALEDRFIVEERDLNEAVLGNHNLMKPSFRPSYKDKFLSLYLSDGLEKACLQAIPRKQFYKLALVEGIKRNRLLVYTFKKVRLILNTLKR